MSQIDYANIVGSGFGVFFGGATDSVVRGKLLSNVNRHERIRTVTKGDGVSVIYPRVEGAAITATTVSENISSSIFSSEIREYLSK